MKDSWIQQIKDKRFKKYSQNGEEGFIKFILENIRGKAIELNPLMKDMRFLVDLGARDGYSLSNSRLLIEEGYKHLSIDAETRGAEDVVKEFITKDNIVDLLENYYCPEDFDLLNIDLDGNDYDILEAILKEFIKPRLIVAEFNGTIPEGVASKIIYNPEHTWSPAEQNYYGFSWSAGLKLAEKYGYKVVFQSDQLNMYMVRKDLLEDPEATIPLGFKKQTYWAINEKKKHLWEEV